MSDEKETVTLETVGKPAWASKGVIGSLVALAAMVAAMWQVKIDTENLTEIILTAIGIIGAIVALWGRIKATKPIVFTGTKPGAAFNENAETRKPQVGGTRKGFTLARLLAVLVLVSLVLAVAVGFAGCGHSQHGVRVYTPTETVTNLPDGSVRTKGGTALLASFNADLPGLKTLKAGEVELEFEKFEGKTIATTTDKKTGNVTITERPIVSGLFTSEVTRAQGEADKSRTDAAGAAGTGVGATIISAPMVGAGLGVIPK